MSDELVARLIDQCMNVAALAQVLEWMKTEDVPADVQTRVDELHEYLLGVVDNLKGAYEDARRPHAGA